MVSFRQGVALGFRVSLDLRALRAPSRVPPWGLKVFGVCGDPKNPKPKSLKPIVVKGSTL